MPGGLVDIGGGVKILSPESFAGEDIPRGISNQLSLMSLTQQLANAPLERKKLESELKLKQNEVDQIGIRNLRENAELLKSVGEENRNRTKFLIEFYKQLPDVFNIDFNAGISVLRSLNPNADAVNNGDGTATIELPSLKTETVDGETKTTPVKESLKITINPNVLTKEQKIALEKDWLNRFENNQQVKNFAEISQSYKNLKAVSKLATGQGDIALMQAFMNINNPGSALRPGQQATLENVGGLGSAFVNLWNKATTESAPIFGKDPNSKERKNFIAAAKALYENARNDALQAGRNAVTFARQQGLNPYAVIQPIGDIPVKEFAMTPRELLNQVSKGLE